MRTFFQHLTPSNNQYANQLIHEAANASNSCKEKLKARVKMVGALALNILNVPRSLIQAITKSVTALTHGEIGKAIRQLATGLINGAKSIALTAALTLFVVFSILPVNVFSPLKSITPTKIITKAELRKEYEEYRTQLTELETRWRNDIALMNEALPKYFIKEEEDKATIEDLQNRLKKIKTAFEEFQKRQDLRLTPLRTKLAELLPQTPHPTPPPAEHSAATPLSPIAEGSEPPSSPVPAVPTIQGRTPLDTPPHT